MGHVFPVVYGICFTLINVFGVLKAFYVLLLAKIKEILNILVHSNFIRNVWISVCVCVCVCERERESRIIEASEKLSYFKDSYLPVGTLFG